MSVGKDFKTLLATPDKPWVEICGRWLMDGTMVLLFGARGCGKSTIALALAQAVASRSRFMLPDWVPSRAYRAIYFDSEMGSDAMKVKLREVDSAAQNSLSQNNFRIVDADDMGGKAWRLSDPEDQRKIIEAVADYDFIVFDNYLGMSARMHRGDDDESVWKRSEELLLALRKSGRTVILVHHSGKSGDQLGTSMKENPMDTVIKIEEWIDDEISGLQMNMFFTKHRWVVDRHEVRPLRLIFQKLETRQSWTAMTIKEAKVEFAHRKVKNGWTKADTAKFLGLSKSQFQELLKSSVYEQASLFNDGGTNNGSNGHTEKAKDYLRDEAEDFYS